MKDRPSGKRAAPDDAPVWLYGRHAVAAAFRNPARKLRQLMVTRNALGWLHAEGIAYETEPVRPQSIDRALPDGAVHQGIAALFEPLPRARLKDVCDPRAGGPVVVLDQVTDPQNIGAVFRLAAAFGAQALIAQDRRTPPLSGALAKAATGAIETVPFVQVVNIARSLEALADLGFLTVGLAGEAATPLPRFRPDRPVALVLGAEGKGLRELVAATCEATVSIPISRDVESLNVATATAIALYALSAELSGS